MKLFYYTIDDLRLGFDPQGEHGWRLSRFLDWRDALEHYRSLPEDAVKALGAGSDDLEVDMVRRLSTGAGTDLEDVLVLDFLALPLWKKDEEVVRLAKELVSELDIRYCLTVDKLVPAPVEPFSSRRQLTGRYLWPDVSGVPESAVRWVYLSGIGWVPPAELKRRFPAPEQNYQYPVVSKYRVDSMTEKGSYAPMEISHWEYLMLVRRTQERLDHRKL